MNDMNRLAQLLLLGTAAALAACGGGGEADTHDIPAADAAPSVAYGAEQTPDAGREIVEIEMLTDEQGNNIFRPAKFEVHQGDVVRFKLVSGVHNVHFPADSNRHADANPFVAPGLYAEPKARKPRGLRVPPALDRRQ